MQVLMYLKRFLHLHELPSTLTWDAQLFTFSKKKSYSFWLVRSEPSAVFVRRSDERPLLVGVAWSFQGIVLGFIVFYRVKRNLFRSLLAGGGIEVAGPRLEALLHLGLEPSRLLHHDSVGDRHRRRPHFLGRFAVSGRRTPN